MALAYNLSFVISFSVERCL